MGVLIPSVSQGATVLFPTSGGTGTSSTPAAGQILIGITGRTYGPAWLTAGTNITISTSSGSITINSTGGGGGGSGVWTTTTAGFIYYPNDVVIGANTTTSAPFWFSTTTGNFTATGLIIGSNITSASTSNWNKSYGIVNASSSNWDLAFGWGNHASAGYMTTFATSVFLTANTGLTTFATSVFALDTDLNGYMTTFATSVFLTANTGLTTFATSVFALDSDLTGYMTTFATSVFALDTDLAGYMTTFATSVFTKWSDATTTLWDAAYSWYNASNTLIDVFTSATTSKFTTNWVWYNASSSGIANKSSTMTGVWAGTDLTPENLGYSNATTNAQCLTYNSTGNTFAWATCGTGGGGDSVWSTSTGGAYYMGNVGIGTSTPIALLNVQGLNGVIRLNGATTNRFIQLQISPIIE